MKAVCPGFAVLFACVCVAVTQGCASKYAGEPVTRTVVEDGGEKRASAGATTGPATREVAMKRPFMIREASLPAGFPAVGPVGEVIVKRYPAYRAARVTAAEVGRSDNSMFGALFDHIKKNDIAMTAPVEMTYPDGGQGAPVDMAFMYGTPTQGEVGEDGKVRVVDLPAMTVVSVALRGSYSEENVREAVAELRGYIESRAGALEVAGPPRLLGYNSPFVPWFMRVSEVQIPVRER